MSQPAPILRVTAGSPVYARDGARVGKVKEVRGQVFKIETGLFQRDYWLPGASVASAAPDAVVTLGVDKNQIDAHKIDEPQAGDESLRRLGRWLAAVSLVWVVGFVILFLVAPFFGPVLTLLR